jgi:hypothetical protein
VQAELPQRLGAALLQENEYFVHLRAQGDR